MSLATSASASTTPNVRVSLGWGEREIEERRGQIHSNTQANIEMAMQERLQRDEEMELALVQKLVVVRKIAAEIGRKRTVPY